MSDEFDFEGVALQEAVRNTVDRRQTSLAAGKEQLGSDFATHVGFQRHWDAFKKRTRLATQQTFQGAFEEIRMFLAPAIDAELEKKLMILRWNRKTRRWE